MPTIEVSYKDLCKQIGKKLSEEELEDALLYVKGEIDDLEGDVLKIELADVNRPDLWCTEGVTREIRRHLELGVDKKINLVSSGLKVKVDKNLDKIRPRTACAVVKGVNMTEELLVQLIQLQEKVCESFGAKRRDVALGVYDYKKIEGNINYKAFEPKEIKFVPLEFDIEMDLNSILEEHPKGQEYKHLLEGMKKYPIFVDEKGGVLSMPPVINSNNTGRVDINTKDLFIECSGFKQEKLNVALNVIVMALVEHNGKVESVDVVYEEEKVVTPVLKEKSIKINYDYIRQRSGLDLKDTEIEKLLSKAGYTCYSGKVSYPAYRMDIMHEADVVEDFIIAYGYNNIDPVSVDFRSVGEITPINKFTAEVANVMVGLGAQEVMSYTLTNKDNLMKKMNNEMKVIEIENPVSANWSVFRTWLVPGLIEFLSKNTTKEYPQQIFEIGEVVIRNDMQETACDCPVRLGYALAGKDVTFTNAKQALEFLLDSFNIEYKIEEIEHNSFTKGRCGRVSVKGKKVAYVGEVAPSVLENWGITFPVVAFELNLSELL